MPNLKNLTRIAITIVAVLAPFAWLAHIYPTLPAVIPNHYDSHGVPHRFAGKGLLWLMGGVSALLTIVIQTVSRFPQSLNLPGPVGAPARQRLEAIALDLLGWLSLEVVLMFDLQIYSIVQTALHHSSPYGDALLFLPVLMIVATAAWYIVLLRGAAPAATSTVAEAPLEP
jgi:uncharacterized membrane protein